MGRCGYAWEDDFIEDDDEICTGEHECILSEDHEGEHECACGEAQEDGY